MTNMCVHDTMQKLLSTFKNMDAVQAYDGAQSIASIPGDLHPIRSSHIPRPDHLSCSSARSPTPIFSLNALSHVVDDFQQRISVRCGKGYEC